MEITTANERKSPDTIGHIQHIDQLKMKIEKLKFICDQLDPYSKRNSNINLKLKEFDLDQIEDPFLLTNKLLLMLENSIEELNQLT